MQIVSCLLHTHPISLLLGGICRNMSRLCWVFVLLAVVVPLSYARTHKCERRGRSLAYLDIAEDALNRAKQLVHNCEEENDSSNSTFSECSEEDKSLGFIEVALGLVSNAKKNIPTCPHVTTGEATTEVTTEALPPKDCQELQASGVTTSGVYTLWLRGKSIQVRCDMETDGGGWTVIQRRGQFSRQENFDRNWKEYKNGFGNKSEEFWIGNDNIFALTNQGNYSLRMDMTSANRRHRAYALFREFKIEDEEANYTLHVDGYIGGTGDSMTYSDGKMFTTKDRDNDENNAGNCAVWRKGGFWYDGCALCNPNGLYKPGVDGNTQGYKTPMFYFKFKEYEGLFSMEMKLKRLQLSSASEEDLQD